MTEKENENLSDILGNIDADVLQFPQHTITADVDNKELSSENSPFVLSLRRGEFIDEKELKKFIKSVEGIVRKSLEYKDWTSYIKEHLGHYTCSLTGEVSSQVNVDIHHHPVSLYKVTKAVIFKYLNASKEFCSFEIAQDVIDLHFENRVGYIPIVRTLHEKYHNGFMNIPMELIYGEWQYAVYQLPHDEEDLEGIQSKLAITKENCGWNTETGYWDNTKYEDAKEM